MSDEAPEARLYPLGLDEISSWAVANRTTLSEARQRFVQLVILESFAAADFARQLAFKGGNALRFAYQYPRSTLDLDFTALDLEEDSETLRARIDRAVRERSVQLGIKCKVTSTRRNPPNPERTRPTYQLNVGYQLPGDRYFADFLESPRPSPTAVPVEISFNDLVCETVLVNFSGENATIKMCTLNDIVAEKLRATLQQVTRNRQRPQDVYDVARAARVDRNDLDPRKIHQYLVAKCAAREIAVTFESFGDEARRRAAYGYEELKADLGSDFIPFEDAWNEVLQLVRQALSTPVAPWPAAIPSTP